MPQDIPEPSEVTLSKEEVAELQTQFKKIALATHFAETGSIVELMHNSMVLQAVVDPNNDGVDVATQLREANERRNAPPPEAPALPDDERNDPDRY
jgi:response regulator of citrate/malate metabolism